MPLVGGHATASSFDRKAATINQSSNIGQAITLRVARFKPLAESLVRETDRQRSLNRDECQKYLKEVTPMLGNTTAVLAILLVIGSSGLSTSAHAGSGGHGNGRGGDGFRDNHCSGSLSGLRNTSGSRYRGHANRASGSGGRFRGYGGSDVWGHWGAYYGPMVPAI